MQIRDGAGQGFLAKVNKENRLSVEANQLNGIVFASLKGDAFTFDTSFITYSTTGSQRALLFIQNSSEIKNFHITRLSISLSVSVDVRLLRNPTSISGGSPGTPTNLNFQSGRIFDGVYTIGADGATIAGGIVFSSLTFPASLVDFPLEGGIILGQNDSIAMTVEFAAGTPIISANVAGFFRDVAL